MKEFKNSVLQALLFQLRTRQEERNRTTLNQTERLFATSACQTTSTYDISSSSSSSNNCNGGPNSSLLSSAWFQPIPRPVPDCQILVAKLCQLEGLRPSSEQRTLLLRGSGWYLRTTPFSQGATDSSCDSGFPNIWTWDTL